MFIPRWKQITAAILKDIETGALGTGDMLPSETSLAKQWGVSHVTAHRALSELQRQGVVLRKPRAGTVVVDPARRATGHVAVFLNTGDALEQQYLAGIRSGLPDAYDLLYCDIRNDPRREATYLKRMQAHADGILCIPTCAPQNTDLLNRHIKAGHKLVCVDCIPTGVNVDAVISDNYGATVQALAFLTGRGHCRIGHFTGEYHSLSSLRERFSAWAQVMREGAVEDAANLVREFPFESLRKPDCPTMAVQEELAALLRQPHPPTAIFCAHDYILAAVVQACRALGVRIPEDLEVVSFNDCPPLVPFIPATIHRIVQNAHEVGRVAADRLCRRMKDESQLPAIVRIVPAFYAAQPR